MRIGEWLTGAPHVNFSPVGLKVRAPFFTSSLGICLFEGLLLTFICCLRAPFEVLVNVHALLVPQDLILHSSSDLLKSIGRALLAWALTWPLLAYAMFLGLAPAFQYLRRRSVERSRAVRKPSGFLASLRCMLSTRVLLSSGGR